MTLRTRIGRLERGRPDAFTALDELLASVASRGLRIHERPADLAEIAPMGRDDLTAALDALRQAPASRPLSSEIQP